MGGSAAHQRHLLSNLATALFEHGKITTTEARARRLRPYAERLITFAKRGDLSARRQVLTVVTDKSVVHTLFTEIGPQFAAREGGYTRITKIGPRKGDNAPMAVIELVEALTIAQEAVGEAERARRTRFARPVRRGRVGGAAAAGAGVSTVEEAGTAESDVDAEAAEAGDLAEDEVAQDEVADEAGEQPAEDVTSEQTAEASDESQAEGDADET